MRRTWQDRLIDWMNGLSFRIECYNVARRVRTEIQCELIRMDAENKIYRYEEAARRVAARRRENASQQVLP